MYHETKTTFFYNLSESWDNLLWFFCTIKTYCSGVILVTILGYFQETQANISFEKIPSRETWMVESFCSHISREESVMSTHWSVVTARERWFLKERYSAMQFPETDRRWQVALPSLRCHPHHLNHNYLGKLHIVATEHWTGPIDHRPALSVKKS